MGKKNEEAIKPNQEDKKIHKLEPSPDEQPSLHEHHQ